MTALNISASEVHKQSIVVDMLDGTILPRHLPGFPIDKYIEKLHEGGVTAFVTCVAAHHEDDFPRAATRLIRWHRLVKSAAGRLRLILTPEDLVDAKARNQVGVIFQFQDARPIDDNLLHLEALYRMGLRIQQLTYQRRNLVGDGCGEPFDGGLSAFGKDVVRECNRLGLVIDLAHGGHRTILDAIRASEAPVLISHTAAHRVMPHVRSVPDEDLVALAEKGGVVGVHALSYLLRPDGGTAGAGIDDMLRHIDYIVKLIGVDHVGIGTDVGTNVLPTEEQARVRAWGSLGDEFPELFVPDFDTAKRYVRGMEACTGFPGLSAKMLEHGYSADDVKKMLGGNFLRVFQTVAKMRTA